MYRCSIYSQQIGIENFGATILSVTHEGCHERQEDRENSFCDRYFQSEHNVFGYIFFMSQLLHLQLLVLCITTEISHSRRSTAAISNE